MGLSRTVFEINGDFSPKSQNFPTPVVCAPAEGVSLGIGYRRWRSKTRMMELPGRERNLTISSAIWIQSINVTDGRMDGRTYGQTTGDNKDRAYA